VKSRNVTLSLTVEQVREEGEEGDEACSLELVEQAVRVVGLVKDLSLEGKFTCFLGRTRQAALSSLPHSLGLI
jgi:hypothetical protein